MFENVLKTASPLLMAGSMFTSLTQAASPAIQCEAHGHNLRQYATSSKHFYVSSIIQFDLIDTEAKASIENILGHIGVSAYPSEQELAIKSVVFNYYGTFSKDKVEDRVSKRAKKYPSSEFFRFNDFDADKTTRYDGGGVWGYFVLSKDASTFTDGSFKGHYVFQAGDHMGGTIDYSCRRRF